MPINDDIQGDQAWDQVPVHLLLSAIRAGCEPAVAGVFRRWQSKSPGLMQLLLHVSGYDTKLLQQAELTAIARLWANRDHWLPQAARGDRAVRGLFWECLIEAVQHELTKKARRRVDEVPLEQASGLMEAEIEAEVVDLRMAISQLSPEEQWLIRTWMTVDTKTEVAQLLGIPYTTVVDRLNRIILKLRRFLQD